MSGRIARRMADKNSTHSTLRERIVEHVFVGEALKALWCADVTNVEVLRSEFDAHGYDLVMARGSTVRHIQLKTGKAGGPGKVSVATALADRPSGCVIWIHITPELDLGPFWWFGGKPGKPLPRIDEYPNALRATRNKQGERPVRVNHRLVPAKQFRRLDTLEDVLNCMFADLSLSESS